MNSSSSSSIPPIKRHGHGYNRRIKRMVGLLASGAGNLSRAEIAAQSHYWLTTMTPEEGRRLRSPAERLSDSRANAIPTDSVKV